MRERWERHREALVAECVREHPGTRPFFWWQVDYEDDGPEGETAEEICAWLDAADRESEAFTLRRRGLLLPGELKRIPRTAFKPLPEGDAA
jgi:hypothetical protein